MIRLLKAHGKEKKIAFKVSPNSLTVTPQNINADTASDGHPVSGHVRSWEEVDCFHDKEKVLSTWQKLDENVAKDLSGLILRFLLCGITKGRRHVPLPPNGIDLDDGTRLVRPRDLKLT